MRITQRFGHLFLLLTLFSVISSSLYAQLGDKYPNYSEHEYEGMRYGLFKPVGYDANKSYPVVIYLHGSTDTTSWDQPWYESSFQKKNPCFVLTPKSIEANLGWGSTFFKGQSANMRKTLAVLDDLISEYSINTNRLYINGTSMGGFGVFSALYEEEGKFAAAYVICGGGTTQATMKYFETPMWIFHGEIDPVVPVKMSRDIYKEIIDHDGKVVRYTEYPGVEHNSWVNANNEKTLQKWLFMQEKGANHGAPEAVNNVALKTDSNGKSTISWDLAPADKHMDKEVWFYKLYNGETVIAEIDNDVSTYSEALKSGESYHIVSVNYFFKESKPSNEVSVK